MRREGVHLEDGCTMAKATLTISSKNYSSWSLRPWLLLKHLNIAFVEESLSFNDPNFKAKVCQISEAGKVPVLVCDDGTVVWDSLAIIETVAEAFPEKKVWPDLLPARAMARSLCSEMHSSFPAVREYMPMNISARLPERGWNISVQTDIDLILARSNRVPFVLISY